jgi:hypothetical protein
MSTRRLILAALVCGLAILVAGGAQLFRLSGSSSVTVDTARVGESRSVGGVRATVLSGAVDGTVTVVRVRLEPEAAIADASSGWALNAGGLRAQVAPPAGRADAPCRGAAVAAGASLTCELAFATGEARATVSYSSGGQQRLWTLAG